MLLPQLLLNHTALTLLFLSDLLGQILSVKFESHKVNRKCEAADFEKCFYGFPEYLGRSKMSWLHFGADSVSASPASTVLTHRRYAWTPRTWEVSDVISLSLPSQEGR